MKSKAENNDCGVLAVLNPAPTPITSEANKLLSLQIINNTRVKVREMDNFVTK